MLLYSLGVNQDIVNKDYDETIQVWFEHSIHQVHKGYYNIVKPNGITVNS